MNALKKMMRMISTAETVDVYVIMDVGGVNTLVGADQDNE
jgi:aryl-phospho-beta-D-glucosidase BglC (GH1 family)